MSIRVKKENDKEYGKFTVKPQDCMFEINVNKFALNTGLSFVASCNLTNFWDTPRGLRDIGGHSGTFWDA